MSTLYHAEYYVIILMCFPGCINSSGSAYVCLFFLESKIFEIGIEFVVAVLFCSAASLWSLKCTVVQKNYGADNNGRPLGMLSKY